MITDDDLSRIGISLPKNLLEQFDEILDIRNYDSRSEGIRDAIRTYTINHQWLSDSHTQRRGVITLVYKYTDDNLLATITGIRYEHNDLIRISLQTQVSRNRRLEVFLVDGDGAQLKALAEQLMGLKGIESVKVTTIPIGNTKENNSGRVGWDAGVQHPVANLPEKLF